MQGDATVLATHPPHTVRIDMDGWAQDWPIEMVHVMREGVVIVDLISGKPIVAYQYVQATQLADSSWRFVGIRDDFTISAQAFDGHGRTCRRLIPGAPGTKGGGARAGSVSLSPTR